MGPTTSELCVRPSSSAPTTRQSASRLQSATAAFAVFALLFSSCQIVEASNNGQQIKGNTLPDAIVLHMPAGEENSALPTKVTLRAGQRAEQTTAAKSTSNDEPSLPGAIKLYSDLGKAIPHKVVLQHQSNEAAMQFASTNAVHSTLKPQAALPNSITLHMPGGEENNALPKKVTLGFGRQEETTTGAVSTLNDPSLPATITLHKDPLQAMPQTVVLQHRSNTQQIRKPMSEENKRAFMSQLLAAGDSGARVNTNDVMKAMLDKQFGRASADAPVVQQRTKNAHMKALTQQQQELLASALLPPHTSAATAALNQFDNVVSAAAVPSSLSYHRLLARKVEAAGRRKRHVIAGEVVVAAGGATAAMYHRGESPRDFAGRLSEDLRTLRYTVQSLWFRVYNVIVGKMWRYVADAVKSRWDDHYRPQHSRQYTWTGRPVAAQYQQQHRENMNREEYYEDEHTKRIFKPVQHIDNSGAISPRAYWAKVYGHFGADSNYILASRENGGKQKFQYKDRSVPPMLMTDLQLLGQDVPKGAYGYFSIATEQDHPRREPQEQQGVADAQQEEAEATQNKNKPGNKFIEYIKSLFHRITDDEIDAYYTVEGPDPEEFWSSPDDDFHSDDEESRLDPGMTRPGSQTDPKTFYRQPTEKEMEAERLFQAQEQLREAQYERPAAPNAGIPEAINWDKFNRQHAVSTNKYLGLAAPVFKYSPRFPRPKESHLWGHLDGENAVASPPIKLQSDDEFDEDGNRVANGHSRDDEFGQVSASDEKSEEHYMDRRVREFQILEENDHFVKRRDGTIFFKNKNQTKKHGQQLPTKQADTDEDVEVEDATVTHDLIDKTVADIERRSNARLHMQDYTDTANTRYAREWDKTMRGEQYFNLDDYDDHDDYRWDEVDDEGVPLNSPDGADPLPKVLADRYREERRQKLYPHLFTAAPADPMTEPARPLTLLNTAKYAARHLLKGLKEYVGISGALDARDYLEEKHPVMRFPNREDEERAWYTDFEGNLVVPDTLYTKDDIAERRRQFAEFYPNNPEMRRQWMSNSRGGVPIAGDGIGIDNSVHHTRQRKPETRRGTGNEERREVPLVGVEAHDATQQAVGDDEEIDEMLPEKATLADFDTAIAKAQTAAELKRQHEDDQDDDEDDHDDGSWTMYYAISRERMEKEDLYDERDGRVDGIRGKPINYHPIHYNARFQTRRGRGSWRHSNRHNRYKRGNLDEVAGSSRSAQQKTDDDNGDEVVMSSAESQTATSRNQVEDDHHLNPAERPEDDPEHTNSRGDGGSATTGTKSYRRPYNKRKGNHKIQDDYYTLFTGIKFSPKISAAMISAIVLMTPFVAAVFLSSSLITSSSSLRRAKEGSRKAIINQ